MYASFKLAMFEVRQTVTNIRTNLFINAMSNFILLYKIEHFRNRKHQERKTIHFNING